MSTASRRCIADALYLFFESFFFHIAYYDNALVEAFKLVKFVVYVFHAHDFVLNQNAGSTHMCYSPIK